MNAVRTMPLVLALLAVAFSGAVASDQIAQQYVCVLEGSQVFPIPTQQPAVGNTFFDLDNTNTLAIRMFECYGVSNGATVHVHGPATTTEFGPVIATLTSLGNGVFTGTVGPLDAQQLRDINCGLWYVDVHTATDPFPWGDLRGQIRGNWGWHWTAPCSLPVTPSTWGMIKSLYR